MALMGASREAHARECMILHSNHDTPTTRRLYAGMTMHTLDASRSVGNRHSGQRKARELIGVLRP